MITGEKRAKKIIGEHMEPNNIFSFVLGLSAGFILAAMCLQSNTPEQRWSGKKDQDKERKDPANWWKYGKSPFDYEDN